MSTIHFMTNLLQYINDGRTYIPEADLDGAYTDRSGSMHIFLSVSDGSSRAYVRHGNAPTLLEAVLDACQQFHFDKPASFTAEAVKLDAVTDVFPATPDKIRHHITKDEMTYKRREDGFIFGDEFEAAFLPEEVEAYGMIRDRRIQRHNVISAFRQHGLLHRQEHFDRLTTEDKLNIYKFRTRSWYADSDGYLPLFRGHRTFETLGADDIYDAVSETDRHYFIHAVNSRGKFVYNYAPEQSTVSPGYNILRHAGTLYAMLETYELTRSEGLWHEIDRAANYLAGKIKPVTEQMVNSVFHHHESSRSETSVFGYGSGTGGSNENQDGSTGSEKGFEPGQPPSDKDGPAGVFCGKELPPLKAVVENDTVKLGGNRLALVALAKYTQVSAGDKYVDTMNGLADWIVFTQDGRGEFSVHKQQYSSGDIDGFNSHYYPGEAVLGLMRLHELDGNSKWLDAAGRCARFLIKIRDKEETIDTVAHDHWLLYGLYDLYRARREKLFEEHTYFIADAMVRKQRPADGVKNPEWAGSYEMKGIPRSTPTACRSEGLGAASRLASLAGDHERAGRYLDAMKAGVRFQLQMQFRPESVMYYENKKFCLGAVHESLANYGLRNDYTQHSISSFISLWRLMRGA